MTAMRQPPSVGRSETSSDERTSNVQKPILLPVVAAALLVATLPLGAGCGGSDRPAEAVSASPAVNPRNTSP